MPHSLRELRNLDQVQIRIAHTHTERIGPVAPVPQDRPFDDGNVQSSEASDDVVERAAGDEAGALILQWSMPGIVATVRDYLGLHNQGTRHAEQSGAQGSAVRIDDNHSS